MNKKYARFLSAFFCAFLAILFTASALTPDREFSEMENRALAQRPEVTRATFALPPLSGLFSSDEGGDFFTGKLMADYETYVSDQFPARDVWVAAKAYAERVVGKKENNDVYFCADSTLISRFDQPDSAKVERNVGYIKQFAQKVDVPVTFGLIPTQAFVWADRLPQGAPNADQRQVYADATGLLTGETAFVDSLWSTLPAHKDEDIFYRTDHHWTSLGAYYGYTCLMDALGRGEEILPLETYEKKTVSEEFYGTVFSSSGVRWVRPDQIDVYVPEDGITVTSHTFDRQGQPVEEPRQLYDESYLEKKDKYSMFLGGQQALGVVKTPNADKPKLLLIRDSYSDSLVPFLTPHFSEIHLVDLRYYRQSVSDYIAQNGIDQAVVLYSVPNFVNENNLVWLGR